VPTTFAHVAILVSDLDRSGAFYTAVCGWRPVFDHAFDDGSLGRANAIGGAGRVRMGEVDGVRIELVEMARTLAQPGPRDQYGVFLLSVVAEDLDVVAQAATATGGDVRRSVPIGQATLLVVADPDGQEVGVIGPPS
jgi:catechol 2,3-dioxygenase-like lactoylglutathione lyase family enzyme